MKNQLCLDQSSEERTARQITTSFTNLRISIRNIILHSDLLRHIADFYTLLLETSINEVQSLHIIHAQIAFASMIFPIEFSPFVRAVFFIWFVITLLICKKNDIK